MNLTGLVDILRDSADYRLTLNTLQSVNSDSLRIIRSARPYTLAALARDWSGPVLFITARGKRAYNVVEQLPVWLGDSRPLYRFTEPTPMLYDRIAWDRIVIRERLETLNALMQPEAIAPVIVTSARALIQRTMPPAIFRNHIITVKSGARYAPDQLIDDLLKLGYEPVTMVIEPGMFSKRGGIVDVFPLGASAPVRIEWFDDEIDVLRTYNPATQRTQSTINAFTLIPAREALPERASAAYPQLKDWFQSLAGHGDEAVISSRQDSDALASGQAFPMLEHYLPYAYPNPVSLLDYLTDDTLIVVEDHVDFEQAISDLIEDARINRDNNIKTQQLPPDYPDPFVPLEVIQADLTAHTVLELTVTDQRVLLDDEPSPTEPATLFKPADRFGGQLRPALTHARDFSHGDGARVIVITEQIERLSDLWREQDASTVPARTDQLDTLPSAHSVTFLYGTLGEGWALSLPDQALLVMTDAEIFNWSRPEPRRRTVSRYKHGRLPESDYSDWNTGDFVVHVDYGIGRFEGLMHRVIEGNEREYLLVDYAGNDRVFVPIHQADRLTRFVGPDDSPPRLSKLGKPDVWAKAKAKAKRAAEDEARELLDIYARREASSGHRFQPDTPWQHELEASFPFVETEDQLRVVGEIKQDMENDSPMDRLVTGDVGYGKTEVALRAAFKAVMDGRQVAILVPTTVLASQHYETFSTRLAPFPLRVEMLSRFRTKAEQSAILTELANGKIDIIIGTHRLLSDDVTLEKLGLVIIDEEQRFGVKHKEHFKKLRAQVDMLTLTATPIPRTLYMSLSGVRDISMIQTPPEERLPVITHVSSWDEKLARQAIMREIDRGGQVFVIHNRVKTLDVIREKLEEIVPEASIITAHGQMNSRILEKVISEFSRGRYDILLATSIIENGVDMPNVNTLIVDRADWFGMSQLYQIRGRVGRGAQQAYAYFFHPRGSRLTEEARARLETLAEYTELGSGFQISVRDLELRGAGDILSMKQTGHVATVGLQLYTQLLQQAVKRLKGDTQPEPSTVSEERIIIDLPIPAYIPHDWIPEIALRLQLYRRIGNLQTLDDLDYLAEELRDRFGQLPRAVEGLLYQIRVKLLAATLNATAIIKPRAHILVKLPWIVAIKREELAQQLGEDVDVSRTAVELTFDAATWQPRLLQLLSDLIAGMPRSLTEEAMGE